MAKKGKDVKDVKEVKDAKATEAEVKEEKPEVLPTNATPHYKKRLEALNEIAQANRESRDALPEEEEPSVEEDIKEANAAAQEAEKEEKEPEAQASEKSEEKKPEEKQKRKFIVDGKEVEFTDEEIAEHVQKSATADTRLREAARLLEDAKKYRTPTRQDVSSASPTQEQSPSHGPLPTASVDAGQTDLVGELTAAITSGDQEVIAKALRKALNREVSGLTPQHAQAIALETIAFNQAKQLLEDPPEKGGFSDLFADPVLKAEFERRENELRDAGDRRPYRELYTAIGNDLRQWRDQYVARFLPKTGLEDRDKLKAKTGVVRGAGARLPAQPEARPKTHEEKLEDMRRARGLHN